MAQAIGIDLGTTNSVVSFLRGGKPEIIPNRFGKNITPSAVFLPDSDSVIVGEPAKSRAEQYADKTFISVKRRMGTNYRRTVNDKEYAPEEISAMILRTLKKDAEEFLGEEVTQAVVTVPANFNSTERQATKIAGEIAGLEVLRVVNEPTAAALAYGHLNQLSQIVLVFDLGGGTFDISVVFAEGNMYDVLFSLGDNRLGGDDFNMHFLGYLVDHLKKEHGLDVSGDKNLLRKVRQEAVKAKHNLTKRETARIYIPEIGTSGGKRVDLDLTINREKFKEIVQPLLERIKQYAHKVVEELKQPKYTQRYADFLGEKLEKCDVILVGGESRVIAVQETLAQEFHGRMFSNINPDEVVAMGAAVQAGILTHHSDVRDIVLVDSTSLSLGTEVVGGGFSVIVPANTPLPVTRTQDYYTVHDNQTSVNVGVYQGESSIAKQNKLLGEFGLNGVPPRPSGQVPILLTYDLDANDILHVEARDKETGRRAEITIKGSQTIPQQEVERMKQEAAQMEQQNVETLRVNRLREKAESLIQESKAIQNMLSSVVHPDYLEKLDNAIKAIQAALRKSDVEEIDRCFYDLYHLIPDENAQEPSISMNVDSCGGFRANEWGRLEIRLLNQGQGAALQVQVTISGATKEKQTGAVAAVYPGSSQIIPLSICPVNPGNAVPISIMVEYQDEAGIPFLVKQEASLEVAYADQPISNATKTVISIGEIINHTGVGNVQSRQQVSGDNVVGSKVGDIVATRSNVSIGNETTPSMATEDTKMSSPKQQETICGKCQAFVPSGFAFCGKCGSKLALTCSNCGSEIPDGFQFCGKCGTKVGS
ncbi:Hsp70 family protein [Candidatus Uabimicrobium amorphum]|uniref:Chaperone protein DnaK n=1 Tax=Uabimicrobium amorphum TaxID=2596890 RepID=A0A5S9F675_UABAM|nr:Hsp70 family protein [Candidatus Uabimicrobium amorphum]BBM86314.1 chaperone protein DnaK [Candidatus Uabimicrobium amorphum]